MISVYDLKPRFQQLLRPLMRALAARGVTPNVVTAVAILGSVAVGCLVVWRRGSRWALLALPAWLLARMALNAVDGMMARELDRATPLGAFLNELGDVVSDAALYLPLARLAPHATWPAVAFVLGAALTEMTGVLAQAMTGMRRYDGPMGKSDRALLVGALALASAIAPRALPLWPWLLAAGAALALLTCWNRARNALADLASRNGSRGPA